MAWTAPKTDWAGGDCFDLDPDYARIKNNLLELKAMAMVLGGGETMPAPGDYSVEDVPTADFYNGVERSIDALKGTAYAGPMIPETRVLRENAAVWDAADLNRIEGSMALLYAGFTAAQNGRYTLPVRLGKGRR